MKSISKEAAKELVRRVKKCDEIDLDDVVHKVLGDNKRHYLNIGIGALVNEMRTLNNMGCKGLKGDTLEKPKTIKVPDDKDYDKAVKDAFNANKNVSLGSIGEKALRLGKKYYIVEYPSFTLNYKINKNIKIDFLKELARCQLVANSMFCFAGSAKIYKQAIKELGGKKSKKGG